MEQLKNKIPLLIILGPTASGKTRLSIELAKKFNGEIVSADSMQVYKGMDIGTAKPTKKEKEGIKHHLMDFLDSNQKFSVAHFVKLAGECIEKINKKNKLPILVGGTGLYIDSLVDNIKFNDMGEDEDYRKYLYEKAQKFGNQTLLDELTEIDPKYAAELHPNNLGRIIRALEMYHVSGINYSDNFKLSRLHESPYDALFIGLDYNDRNKLYDNINKRIDIMIETGLLEEAKQVLNQNNINSTAIQAIGYKEFIAYFKGEADIETVVENLKKQSRRYAKRQKTWFRKNEKINWIFIDEYKDFNQTVNIAHKLVEKWKFI